MSKCIYCLKDNTQTTFKTREHVMPRCLGSYLNSPTIKGDLVCDVCNSTLFTRLETNFTEDTYEGVFGQRLNFEGRGSVIIRDKNYKITRLNGFGDHFFDEMFLFLEPKDQKIVPSLKNQIKLRRFNGGFRVFFPETLRKIPRHSAYFQKLSNDMKKLNQKDMAIFGENTEDIQGMIALLHEFGVNYKEKESKYHQFKPGDILEIHEEYSCTIDKDIARVFAKVAFNHFAYCALQDGRKNILFHANFDKIRNFIHAGEGEMKSILTSFNEDPVLKEERDTNMRVIMHFINFLPEDGNIVVRLTFFGRPAVYKVILGKFPAELESGNFGGGHAFDPFAREIHNLSQTPVELLSPKQVKLNFGLFRRN